MSFLWLGFMMGCFRRIGNLALLGGAVLIDGSTTVGLHGVFFRVVHAVDAFTLISHRANATGVFFLKGEKEAL